MSILVHDSIRRWILWLFTSTICIPEHQIHASCGIMTPKQQPKRAAKFQSKTTSFFCKGILATPCTEAPLLPSPSIVTSMSTGGSADCSASCSGSCRGGSAAGSAGSADGSSGSGLQGLPDGWRRQSSFDCTSSY